MEPALSHFHQVPGKQHVCAAAWHIFFVFSKPVNLNSFPEKSLVRLSEIGHDEEILTFSTHTFQICQLWQLLPFCSWCSSGIQTDNRHLNSRDDGQRIQLPVLPVLQSPLSLHLSLPVYTSYLRCHWQMCIFLPPQITLCFLPPTLPSPPGFIAFCLRFYLWVCVLARFVNCLLSEGRDYSLFTLYYP